MDQTNSNTGANPADQNLDSTDGSTYATSANRTVDLNAFHRQLTYRRLEKIVSTFPISRSVVNDRILNLLHPTRIGASALMERLTLLYNVFDRETAS